MVRATSTAVQVKDSPTWYHLNHCVRAPTAREDEEDQDAGLPRDREDISSNDSGDSPPPAGVPVSIDSSDNRPTEHLGHSDTTAEFLTIDFADLDPYFTN